MKRGGIMKGPGIKANEIPAILTPMPAKRYIVHTGTPPTLKFIRDTQTGELVRGKDNRLRSFLKERDAQKAVDKLNKGKS